VILVDDASGDETPAVLRTLRKRYPSGWIRVIEHAENGGPGRARNTGWEAASQPYIAFLDADDSWHPEKLRLQYEHMHNNPRIDVLGHQRVVIREGTVVSQLPMDIGASGITPRSLLFRNCFSTPTVMLKRTLKFRFETERRYCEDVRLWQQIAFGGGTVMRLEAPLAFIYKAPYGEAGLSASLWEMEKAELWNLQCLYKEGKIDKLLFCLAGLFSMAKYIRRLVYVSS
jgi:glycosyltransferase involved in cell wall biosynthesis